ncbi:guanine nucleotide exchange protein for ADP-robosylation factor [Rhizina undulata]
MADNHDPESSVTDIIAPRADDSPAPEMTTMTEIDNPAPEQPSGDDVPEEGSTSVGAADADTSEPNLEKEIAELDVSKPLPPTISEPEKEEAEEASSPQLQEDPREEMLPSQGSLSPSLRNRELPPLPDHSSDTPTLPGPGIPIPIITDRSSSPHIPEDTAPTAPTRTSSRNAPTSVNPHKRLSSVLSINNGVGQPTFSSMIFVIQALESIGASKEAKRRKNLGDSVQKALEVIKATAPDFPPDPSVIFEPLQIACTVQNTQLATTALDCIGKLISYSYFAITPIPQVPPTPSSTGTADDGQGHQEVEHHMGAPLIEKAIETICDCFQGDTTPDAIQLQIIKALLAAVLNDKAVVHGAGLLKAIRQTYNIFLLSRNSSNQMTAQGTLTQMVHTVFERAKVRSAIKEATLRLKMENGQHVRNASSTTLNVTPPLGEKDESGRSVVETEELVIDGDHPTHEKITLQSFENRKSFDDERIADNTPTIVTRSPHKVMSDTNGNSAAPDGSAFAEDGRDDEDEVFIKDAFLVFRAMCKLSIKTLPPEQIADLKSHGMRSKLLSLHLIHTILKTHMVVFTSPMSTIKSSTSGEATGFIHAIKQYLCLSLSRNAASAVPLVFEVCCEIFWLVLSHARVMLKKEIEVFLKEIYLNILDNRHSSVQQKQYLLGIIERLCSDPRALVEIYLNYDCDRSALDNMYQRIIEHLSRITTTPVQITELQQQQFREQHKNASSASQHAFSLPPSLSTATISATPNAVDPTFPVEYSLKRQSLECLINVLQSLVTWSQKEFVDALQESVGRDSDDGRVSTDHSHSSPRVSMVVTPTISTPQSEAERRGFNEANGSPVVDDPNQLEKAKQRKTALLDAIKAFNYKPKRGVKMLIDQGFIRSSSPEHIAEFLYRNNTTLSKAVIGEYLGEGDAENVAIMHAFVDMMDFTRMRFVDALRLFLQSFRLPGESQKIDRYMLKFAERYISGNPNAFANADTAYVFAYSVIMLNTDQHSSRLKGAARMTKEDFIANNRGINDNADLPPDYLGGVYEEIQSNEIVLEGERDASKMDLTIQPASGIVEGIGRVLANAGRDLGREAYVQASEEMANKTEQLFKTLLRAQRRNGSKPGLSRYIAASSSKHVGPMFEVTWMSFLSGLSGAAQDTNDIETIRQCMEGFKLAIRVACFFELETPRVAFVSALAKFTHLNNLSEMKVKNVEALKVLLDVAQLEGNMLKDSWRDVLTCISQLERFQLISSGVDEGSVPDVTKGGMVRADDQPRPSMQSTRPPRQPLRARATSSTMYVPEVAEESRSREVVIAVDRIFANTSKLSGEAIVHFVRALSEVSWQEIQSSGQSEHPRMFSLQKLVEISYYNMGRIRVEWSNLWNILGEHFNQVGCHSNTSVVFFALDSLRQLSMRFLEKQELPHFKFQKDFLRPFEHVIANNTVVPVKDMVLRCLNQMLQARGDNIRSGWRTMFGVFTIAAKESYDSIVNLAFENVRRIYRERFSVIVSQGAFADMIICLTEFAKNHRFQKVSLQAIETLKGTVPHMLSCPECPLSQTTEHFDDIKESSNVTVTATTRTVKEDPMVKFWFPVLFAFHDILMTGEDLEARTRALGYLFDTLVKYGGDFPADFWDTVCHELLFPIFMVLKSRSELTHFSTQESVGMWLSTTMIQALRNLIALFTHYFELLERMLDGFLDLLVTCICQENDTIARIGSSCLQQLILQSVKKLRPEHWTKIVSAFVQLFETTTADQLFSAATPQPVRRSSAGSSLTIAPSVEIKTPNNELAIEEEVEEENSLKINGLPSPTLPDDASDKSASPDRARSSSMAHQHAAIVAAPSPELEDYRPQQLQQQPVVTAARRRFFNKIITKCVLQLLMIETVSELFSNDAVYSEIPSTELLRLMGLLKKSFTFARRFNGDKELRMRLWREGFMKQPPNLLKQESGSAATYVSILLRMFHDDQRERRESRGAIEAALIPLCVDIIRGYVILDEETQQRNIIAWRPVVVDVLEGYTNFQEKDFDRHIDTFFPLTVELLNRELGPEVRVVLQNLLRRIGEVRRMGIPGQGRDRRRLSSVSARKVS